VAPPVDPDDLRALLRLQVDPNPQPVLAWDQVCAAQAEVAALPVTDEAVDAIVEITVRLRGQDIRFSPRRFRQTQDVARGAAWLAGADEVRPEHLEVLRNMLWDTPAQRPIVERTVLEISSPMQREILELADTVAGLSEAVDDGLKLDDADPGRGAVLLETRRKAERAMGTAIDLEDRATGRAAANLADTMRRMEKLYSTIAFELAGVSGVKSLADSVRDSRRK
jgi:MoxR-like ATPase